ncbi:MAG: BamA/TamA family outer membrane protein [Chitinophagaceae bacterium]
MLLLAVSTLLLPACSNTRYLSEQQQLYTGSSVKITDKNASKKERKNLKSELNAVVRPLPNRKTLGMRLRLSFYNWAGASKKNKGLRHWLGAKFGEPPVLASSVNIATNEKLLQNQLQNSGYFFARVTGTMEMHKRKASASFEVSTGPQYHIRETVFAIDSDLYVASDIKQTANKTLLKPNAPFNLEIVKAERLRIERDLKDRGYYLFKPDYLYVEADTTAGNFQVDMRIRVKRDSIPDDAYRIHKLNQVFIYANYQLNRTVSDTNLNNAVYYKGLHILDKRKRYRPFLFRDMMLFDSGQVYNRTIQNRTISRFVNLNTFKFVKNRFELKGDTLLDVYYYLSPFPRKSLRFEVGANTQNDSRAGSSVSISWRNRNAFRAAEEFYVKLNGGFESQYTGIAQQPSIYTVGGELGISFPYFVVPFFKIPSNSSTVPRTVLKTSYGYESQKGLLRINSYKVSFGYDWKETLQKEHQFYPFNINYVKTDTFSSVSTQATYANLLFDGLIIGPTYEFTYNSQIGSSSPDNYYFDGLADFSGVLVGAIDRADYKTNPSTIFGQTYAQYAKLQADFRYYHRFNGGNIWANRILIGAGIPYGNSSQLPNIKQFFSGGNSSLRGFRSRLMGPGTFNEKYLKGTTNYIQTLGDLKLELNTEMRVNVYRFFKLGFFADAGNIWLYNDNPAFPGGKFSPSFMREFAVDVGLGLRFDFKILLLRFDAAIPVRKPWLPEGDRWVFRQIDFGSPEWRSDNLIFNLAIGYPF